jgi:tetratricopeptide (TPR) repeat protein
MGQYAKAEILLVSAVDLARRLDSKREEYPLAMSNLAAIYRDQGRYPEALKESTRALFQWDAYVKKPDDLKRARILEGIGKVYCEQKLYAQAESQFASAEAIYDKTLGRNDAQLSSLYLNQARLCRFKHQLSAAVKLAALALTLDRTTYGADHPYVASDENSLAGIYCDMGEFDRSDSLFRHSLVLKRKTFGLRNPMVANSLYGLGELQAARGDVKGAETTLRETAQMQLSLLGDNHPELARTYDRLGTTYIAEHKCDQAKVVLEKALTIRERALRAGHPDTEATRQHLKLLGPGS